MRTMIALLSLVMVIQGCHPDPERKILVFMKTAGFHHASISDGAAAILKLGKKNKFLVDTTTDAGYITEDSLRHYSAVVFLNTTGDLLNQYQEADLERFVQAGGGFVGIHAAADAEYDWDWYGRMVGAYFNSHPEPQEAILTIVDPGNPSTRSLPAQWKRNDEWYNFNRQNKDVHVLITIEEKSYRGGTNGDNHPIAWCHDYDGGRAFYTALGHTAESYTESLFLKHLLGGIRYAIGDKLPDYSRVHTKRLLPERHF